MKISIIGGGGLVGSSAAFACQARQVGSHIVLIDVHQDVAAGHALDLQHGAPSMADQFFEAGGYEHIPDCDLICITAGSRRKPDESRLDLIHRNTKLFMSILEELKRAGLKKNVIILVVSNPVDVLTYVATKQLPLPASRVLGLGTQLDSIRFRSLIAAEWKVAPTQVQATILGEHGDSMVPIWSSASINGLAIDQFPDWSPQIGQRIFERTRQSGAEVIRQKGGAGFAVGVAIADIIAAIQRNERRLLPVSTVQDGSIYGIRDVALSVPSVVAAEGVTRRFEIGLWPREQQSLRNSEAMLKKTIAQVLN